MPDQKAIGQFFGKKIHKLPKEFNCEKRLWKGKNYKIYFDKENILQYKEVKKIVPVKLLHYVSQKAWEKEKSDINKGYEEIEKLWWEYYNE